MNIFRRLWSIVILFFDLTKVAWQIIFGAWKLDKIPHPIVTIFGGAHLEKGKPYGLMAQDLSRKLLEKNISVITGGGTGIMEAASCVLPLKNQKARIVGIGIPSLNEERNTCVKDYWVLDYLFARKWLMIRYSSGFIAFPGGFGTLDEITSLFTLIYTKEIVPVPIILVGTEYWKDFMTWVKGDAVKAGLIAQEQLHLFTLTDDVDQIVSEISKYC